MKIVYISTTRVPDNWAHTLQIMKTCEALAQAGAEVELVVPRRHSTAAGDPFELMGVEPVFTVRRLWALDLMQWKVPFAFRLMTLSFFISVARHLQKRQADALYVRGELVIPLAKYFGKKTPIFWETHERPRRDTIYKNILPRIRGIITVTEYYRQELVKEWGLPESSVITAPDAVDVKRFALALSRQEARSNLDLPHDRTLVVYTGTDIAWKGLGVLREAITSLPENYLVAFVGNIEPGRVVDEKALFPGFRPRSEIPLWLAAADMLMLAGTATSTSSSRYTSPMKLFEYLAAGRPIVASDLPSFREVVNEEVAYFFAPDDPQSLAEVLCRVASDPQREEVATRARVLADRHSWEKRGERILTFIKARL
jgi:glycosyltransferase involved in cell wall biosynthesis